MASIPFWTFVPFLRQTKLDAFLVGERPRLVAFLDGSRDKRLSAVAIDLGSGHLNAVVHGKRNFLAIEKRRRAKVNLLEPPDVASVK